MHEAQAVPLEEVLKSDWGGGKSPYAVSWGKLMMWLFILSDAFTFGGLLAGYGALRVSSGNWPDLDEIFALHLLGKEIPLLLIAIMTFILICSSATMVLAVAAGYKGLKQRAAMFMGLTMLLGLSFLGCQAFEWSKLIHEGARLTHNPWGAPSFGACFFLITGFHGSHVLSGVIYLGVIARRVLKDVYSKRGSYEGVEIAGLYWHFVDLVWVFIFAFFYLF